MRPLAAAAAVAALVVALACGSRTATLGTERAPAESAPCRDALAVRDGVLARPEAQRDDVRRAVTDAAALGSCEDGDPSTGTSVDLALLRQRLDQVVDRAAPVPAQPAQKKAPKGTKSKGG